ncbi:MAG: prepilin-type N-terminal cleavage/methylation domain-containing protein [Magnetococcus sp. YQC-5]
MVAPLAGRAMGFTLLEALVALTISAFLLSGLYRMVNGTVVQVQALEHRADTVHLWMHLRRLLNRDLDYLAKEPPARIILEEKDTLILRCTGDIVPDWHLGPQVEVIYHWKNKPTNDGMIWERRVQSLHGTREEAQLTLRIDQGLDKVEYALLDAKEWHAFGEAAQQPWRAIRWHFVWQNIGEWRLIHNLQSFSFTAPELRP